MERRAGGRGGEGAAALGVGCSTQAGSAHPRRSPCAGHWTAQLAFFERVARMAPATQDVVRVFEEGHEQLAEKSELLKEVTRREYLKYRCVTASRSAAGRRRG